MKFPVLPYPYFVAFSLVGNLFGTVIFGQSLEK